MWLPDTDQDRDNRVAEVERDFHRGGVSLADHVPRMLDNAMANGYDVDKWPDEVIAADLSENDAGCQGIPASDLVIHIAAWKRSGK